MKKHSPIFRNLTDDDFAKIADRIVLIRQDRGLTQEQFSHTLGISQTYLSLLEKGSKPLTESVMKQLVRSFNVNDAWLLQGEPNPMYLESSISELSEKLEEDVKAEIKVLQQKMGLSDEETKFLSAYLLMSPKKRKKIMELTSLLLDADI